MQTSAGGGWRRRRTLFALVAGLAISVAAGLSFGKSAADQVEARSAPGAAPPAPAAAQLPDAANDPLAIDTGHAMAASAGYTRMSDCQRLDLRFQLGCRRFVSESGRATSRSPKQGE